MLSSFDTQPMSERDEINLWRAQKTWQAKQNSSGAMTMTLCALSVGAFLYFATAPSQESASILAVLLVALIMACIRLVSCAAKVVETQTSLQPVRIQSDIVDVEVVETPRHQEYRKLPHYI
jgi:hypothetical protein